MKPDDAAATLLELESVRRRTRGVLRSFWLPLVVFGPLMLTSGLLALFAEGRVIGLFWAVAGPAASIATGLHYRNRERRLGLSSSPLPYVLVMVAMLAGAFILPALTSGQLRGVVSLFAIAAGYLAFAALDRELWLVWLGLALALVPLALLAVAPDLAAPGSGVILGTAFLVTGLVLRRRELAAT